MIWACEIRWAIQSRQRSPATISSQMITSRRSVRPSRICLIRLPQDSTTRRKDR
jgi:hypothetical protein